MVLGPVLEEFETTGVDHQCGGLGGCLSKTHLSNKLWLLSLPKGCMDNLLGVTGLCCNWDAGYLLFFLPISSTVFGVSGATLPTAVILLLVSRFSTWVTIEYQKIKGKQSHITFPTLTVFILSLFYLLLLVHWKL